MSRTHHNPRLIKGERTYDVEQAARLFNVHRNTIRAWLKVGLHPIDTRRPLLIKGTVLRAFIEKRRSAAKRPCPPGTLYCFKCRQPKAPALGMAEFVLRSVGLGNLRALCTQCSTVMNRRARQDQINAILPGTDIQITQAKGHITDTSRSSLNRDLQTEP